MYIFTASAVIISILNLGLAIFILTKKFDTILGKFLGLDFLSIFIWIGANVLADISKTESSLILWSGISVIATCLFIGFYLCFIEKFINPQKPINKIKLLIFLSPLLCNVTLAFSRYSIKEVYFPINQPAQISPGFLYWIAPIIASVILLYGIIKLLIFYKKQNEIKKTQIKYIEIGFILTTIGGTIFVFILPILGEYRFYALGPQFSIFLIGFTSYAILKHRLLDIRIVIQKSIIYTLIFGIFFIIYLSLIYAFDKIFALMDLAPIISSFISAILIILFYSVFKKYFLKITDRFFYRYPYNVREVLKEINEKCNALVDLDQYFVCLVNIIEKRLKINKILLVILKDDNSPSNFKNHNFNRKLIDLLKNVKIFSPKLSEYFIAHKMVVNFQNDNSDLDKFIAQEKNIPLNFKKQLENFGANLFLPIYKKRGPSAFLLFGPKLSEEAYYPQDIQFFDDMISNISLAFENINLYSELKKHSKNLESKVQERTEELKMLNKNQARFMADISHELQTPLAILKGNLSILVKQKMSRAETRKYYLHMERSIDRLSHIINDLIFLSKADSEKINVQKEYFNLSDLVQKSFDDSLILAEDKGIKLVEEIKKNIWIWGDQNLIQSLLFNLISNALKFTERNKGVKIKLMQEQSNINLVIEDQGVGIAPENLPHIFSRFYRIEQQGKEKGTGLGLSICKWIVEAHKGKIEINSQPGQGTTIRVDLPYEV